MKRIGKQTGAGSPVPSKHPLVGTWEQEENAFHKTSVVYEIHVKEKRFVLNGRDEQTGEVLDISRVDWDGETLRFTTYFAPRQHRATHGMRMVGRGRAIHDVSRQREYWIRRPTKIRGVTTRKKQSAR